MTTTFACSLAVHFHAGNGVPPGKLDPGAVAEHALGVDHVDEAAGMIREDEGNEESSGGIPAKGAERPASRTSSGQALTRSGVLRFQTNAAPPW